METCSETSILWSLLGQHTFAVIVQVAVLERSNLMLGHNNVAIIGRWLPHTVTSLRGFTKC